MKMTGAQAVVQCFLEQGVDTVFGYPGGMILPLYDALYDEKRIRQVLTSHEQGASHAADGYARASGKVGVCIATSGPGATNLVTGLAAAFMDSVPVVAITGQVDTALLGRDAFQEIDILNVTMPITKHNFQVKSADKLCQTVRRAFRIAASGRQGPVLIDVPRDILMAEVELEKVPEAIRADWQPDAAMQEEIGAAAAIISQAEKPLIVAGGGVISAGAGGDLLHFAEQFSIPVANTLMGLGSMPRDHALSLGLSGMHGLKAANHAVFEADVVLAIGSRFGDRLTGNRAKYSKDKHFIHIDIDPAEIDKNVMSAIGLAGEISVILDELAKRVKKPNTKKWMEEIAAWQKEFAFPYDDSELNMPWAMHYVAEATRNVDAVFVTDVGQHQMWAAQHLRMKKQRTWITSGGLGSMGFGLPAAMGACLATSRRIIHIAGDGGIKMTGNEYYTIARLHLPVISIIVDNSGLGMIRQLQKVFYKQRYIACELSEMDFVKYAESFGIHAARAATAEEFRRAFDAALQSQEPEVIVMKIKKDFVRPMTKAGAEINEFVDL